jgi:hypothetical protein
MKTPQVDDRKDLTAHNIAHYFEILECFFTFFRERSKGGQGLSNEHVVLANKIKINVNSISDRK